MLGISDRSGLHRLAHEELPGLYALARWLAGSDAEELVQQTLLRARGSSSSLRDHQAGPRWLRGILTRVWLDRVREHGREPLEVPVDEDERFSLYRTLVEEDPLPDSATPHVDFLGAFSQHDVHVVVLRLPPRYRAPLVLRYVEGLDTAEIAEMLDVPRGSVLSRLQRGRQRFEREMWSYADEFGIVAELHPLAT